MRYLFIVLLLFLTSCDLFTRTLFDINLREFGTNKGDVNLVVSVGAKIIVSATITRVGQSECDVVAGTVNCTDNSDYSVTRDSIWTSSNTNVADFEIAASGFVGNLLTRQSGTTSICAEFTEYGCNVLSDCATLTVQ